MHVPSMSWRGVLAGVTYQVFERGQLAWTPIKDPWMVPLGDVFAERLDLDISPQL